ncbi:FAD binding domain-containing protein [Candidatus Poriferisocius sp.]|uniref:FAD binding domain-containing protein n=1 Tax=Candidatus Poriferisocius sp. TaxID=3101276 RepID=UPI003B5A236A
MFPSRFEFVAATTVAEAVEAKVAAGEGGRFLAGGQSLLPMMKMRVAFPDTLIDINGVAGLDAIGRSNGHLQVGALVRHADVVASDATFGAVAAAAPWVADPLVRNRGTMCGSVAHCDPEGDWNSVLLATGAEVMAQGPGGQRSIPIGEFVDGAFTSTLAEDEMVVGLRIPVPAGRAGGAYLKLERKIGDYATVAVATHLELDDAGAIAGAGLALTSVNPVNTKVTDAEALLVGQSPSEELFAEAAELAVAAAEPRDDVRGTAAWKRQVVRTYTRRGLAAAAQQANENQGS